MTNNLKRKLNVNENENENELNINNNNNDNNMNTNIKNNNDKNYPNVLDCLFIVNPFYIKFNIDNLIPNKNNILSDSINLIEIESILNEQLDSSDWMDKIKNNVNLLILYKMFQLTKENSDKQINLEFKYLYQKILELTILNNNDNNNNIENILSNCNIIKAKIKNNNCNNTIDLCSRLFFPSIDENLNNSRLFLNNAKIFNNEDFQNCGTFNYLSSSILDEDLKFYMTTECNAYKLLSNTSSTSIKDILKLGTKILDKNNVNDLMKEHLYGPKIIPNYNMITKEYLDEDKLILFNINHLMFHFIYTKKKNDISFNHYNLNFDDTVDNYIIIKLSLFDSIVTEISKYINNTYNTPQNLNSMEIRIFEDSSIYNLICDQFKNDLNEFKTFNLNLSLDFLIETFDYNSINNKIPGFINKFYEKEVIDKLLLETSLSKLIIN